MTETDYARVSADSPFKEVIDRAYRVFCPKTPSDTEGCACCWPDETRLDFFNHGQRGLPFHYVTEWFQAAVPPKIPKDLWAWILPRVLEILAAGRCPADVGVEVSLSRFPTGDRTQWSGEEWEVIDAFQRLFIEEFTPEHDDFLDDILCMFAEAGWPVDDLFDQVFAWPTERLVNHLYSDWAPAPGMASIWTTTFWSKASVPMSKWSDPALGDRFLLWSYEEGVSTELATKAVELAETIGISG